MQVLPQVRKFFLLQYSCIDIFSNRVRFCFGHATKVTGVKGGPCLACPSCIDNHQKFKARQPDLEASKPWQRPTFDSFMTWADWEREHPLDFICPFCPFNLPNLRHSIEDHFKAHHPDKNPWANPYEQEEQDDSQSPASSQPSSQSDMFASQETKSKAIAESTRLDDRSQMQSTHVLEAVSLSPVVAQQEQEEMEAEEEMPTLAEATTQQLEQIPGGLYHKRLRDDKRAREEEERKRKERSLLKNGPQG